MIDKFAEKVAVYLAGIIEPYIDKKIESIKMDIERQTGEVIRNVDDNVRDQLNTIVTRIANEVASRFRL